MRLQTCLCLSLTCFCRIRFFLQNTPSVGGFSSPVDASCCWRVSFHGICHPDLSALSPWILSHLLQLCRVLHWSQGSISNIPVSVSTVCRADSLCDCPKQIFGSGFLSLREALGCVSHQVQVTHHFHLETLQAFPAWISIPRTDIYAKLCWTIPVCPQVSISSNFLMCWMGLGGSFLSFHTSGNTFPLESGKNLFSIPHFLLFFLLSVPWIFQLSLCFLPTGAL